MRVLVNLLVEAVNQKSCQLCTVGFREPKRVLEQFPGSGVHQMYSSSAVVECHLPRCPCETGKAPLILTGLDIPRPGCYHSNTAVIWPAAWIAVSVHPREKAVEIDCLCAGILFADVACAPVDHVPKPGELVPTERMQLGLGGCASNAGLDLAKVGYRVGVSGCVGDDFFGRFIVEALAAVTSIGHDSLRFCRAAKDRREVEDHA